jgi:hypothetical protein
MADTAPSDLHPDPVWRAFGRNLAAGAGALTALLSLLAGTSVSTACLRGTVALLAVLFLTRLGSAALAAIERSERGAGAAPAPARVSAANPPEEAR